jgi:hypothetical protein
VQQALDLGQEPRAMCESYGMTILSLAALTARRLVEAGSEFVTVFCTLPALVSVKERFDREEAVLLSDW